MLVTTYQAGKLVVLRADQDHLNTHFRNFSQPMGLAVAGDRLAVGTVLEIWEYHNVPAVAPSWSRPAGTMPAPAALGHVTGDIQIHEMAWVGDELWFVNTRFSCLCTRSATYSFVPRWRPPFISALAPEDRCHLNGLGMRDGRPRYVTALGETDSRAAGGPTRRRRRPAGRADRRGPGAGPVDAALAALVRRAVVGAGIRPGRLRLRRSAHRAYVGLAELPGFTRGLDFCGPLAFIGLSQVRETAVFSGIPIAERPLEERACGVWVVDIADGPDGRVREVRGRRAGDLRGAGAAGDAIPGTDQRQRSVDLRFVCVPDAALDEVAASHRGPGAGDR